MSDCHFCVILSKNRETLLRVGQASASSMTIRNAVVVTMGVSNIRLYPIVVAATSRFHSPSVCFMST